jgi:hypothetical protein
MDTKSAKPESPQGKENKSLTNNKAIGRRSVMLLAAMCLFSVFIFVAPAAAADVTNSTVDWNGLGNMISGAAGLFPDITTLIMAVIPILILLIIVGFITGLFDSIIQAVRGAISFMK